MHRHQPIARCGRWLVALVFALQMTVFVSARVPEVATDLPFAGDDTFQVGPTAVGDPTDVSVVVDRAYGPLADDMGHLRSDLIGKSVAPDTAFEVAPTGGAPPSFSVAINGFVVPGSWQPVGSDGRVYRLMLPTAHVLFPAPGDADNALVPRTNTLTLTGASSLDWLRLIVPGPPPALLMAGADLSCSPTGPTDPTDTWDDWGRWLTADGIPSRAPARDGRLTVVQQLPALDNGYASLRHAYGPDRPGLAPRVTLVGYSMGGLVARLWAFQHPGVVTHLVEIASPDAGTDAATNFFAALLSPCASGALHDLAPIFVSDFNKRVDLSHYWDPDPPAAHITTVAAVPTSGDQTDGVVTEASADALPYATHLTWTPDATGRSFSLHTAIPHAETVYTDLRDASQFASPLPDARTGE